MPAVGRGIKPTAGAKHQQRTVRGHALAAIEIPTAPLEPGQNKPPESYSGSIFDHPKLAGSKMDPPHD